MIKNICSIISKCKAEWAERPLFYSLLLFTLVFLFSRLIILFIPYVEITYDSIEYANYIDSFLAKGLLPPTDYLPIGYPIILKILSLLHNSIYSIIIVQNVFTFIACMSVIIATEKRYPLKSLFVVIPLCIFVLSPKNAFYDISLITESLYVSSLICISAVLILAINSNKRIHWILLSISLFIPLLFRPNGIFTIVIYLIIILYCIFQKRGKTIILCFGFPYIILMFIYALYSFSVSKTFSVSSPSRMKQVLNMNIPMDSGSKIDFDKISNNAEKPSIRKAIKQYYMFKGYHSLNPKLKNIYQKYHDFNWPSNINYGPADKSYFVDMNHSYTEYEKRVAFKEFYNKSYAEFIELRAIDYRKTILFKFYDWYQMHIHKYFFASLVWPILFLFCFISGVILFFKSKFKDSSLFILILLGLLNIGTNMIHIVTIQRILARYEYPGEFLYYLAPFFLLICLKNARK